MPRDITKLRLVVEVEQDNGDDSWSFVTNSLDGKTELEPVVNEDLRKFSEFYTKTLNNGSISRYELAAIKTYLHWKTHPEKK